MAAIKTKQQRIEIKNHVAKLYLQGYSFTKMEAWINSNTEFSISRHSCSTYVGQILEEWHNERVNDVDKWITAELMGLNNIEYEAMQAWELSKKDKTKNVSRKRGKLNTKGNAVTATSVEDYEEIISGVGDPRFLEIAKDCRLQRLQYLTKGSFSARDGGTTVNIQQIVEVGVVHRVRPTEETHTINTEIIDESN